MIKITKFINLYPRKQLNLNSPYIKKVLIQIQRNQANNLTQSFLFYILRWLLDEDIKSKYLNIKIVFFIFYILI